MTEPDHRCAPARPDPKAATPARVAALGPFFAFETRQESGIPGPPPAPWRALGELLDDPSVLRARVTAVRGYLAAAGGQPVTAVEERVAASVTQLGLASRLLSPAFAVGVLTGEALPFDPRRAWWQPVPGGPFPLSLPRRTTGRGAGGDPGEDPGASASASADQEPETGEPWDPVGLADRLARDLLDGPIRELVAAAGAYSLSPHILWGNVASAVNGAASAIARTAPELAGRAGELATQLLDRPPLRGAGGPTADGGGFRRRSCCLIYRAAPDRAGALCGDCVLTGRPRPLPGRAGLR
ncbi:(2Fe-2S)-binding protein [Kitasatospora sp. NBC_01287]|uniref:(2Fe-2S)-binding protein n=1 Tax=Kitasatospora sp. NBC_01287 TaxID=2903573 RepID=UPI002259FA19|nr:(2Fe-2S)-binding protein [Kitasatospora sp. NBC_01287]MCX4750370.1 (2Fe-2S)-binding protein [Kitasatospora sp. NBC_01287]